MFPYGWPILPAAPLVSVQHVVRKCGMTRAVALFTVERKCLSRQYRAWFEWHVCVRTKTICDDTFGREKARPKLGWKRSGDFENQTAKSCHGERNCQIFPTSQASNRPSTGSREKATSALP